MKLIMMNQTILLLKNRGKLESKLKEYPKSVQTPKYIQLIE